MSKASDKAAALRALAGIQGQRGDDEYAPSKLDDFLPEPTANTSEGTPQLSPKPLVGDLLVTPHTDKTSSLQNDMLTNRLENQTGVSSPAVPAELKRFTTYLTPPLIKALKLHAVQFERDIYEVVREALERYLGLEEAPIPDEGPK